MYSLLWLELPQCNIMEIAKMHNAKVEPFLAAEEEKLWIIKKSEAGIHTLLKNA
jgi:hypothetical protein